MIQTVSRASHLALRNRRSTNAVNVVKLYPRPSHASPRFFYSTTRAISHKLKSKALTYNFHSNQPARFCSYRSKMCRANAETEGSIDVTKSREVLPTNVKPVHYDLTLEPDFDKFSYQGTVTIE